jgi:hypothetical protein
MTSGDFFRDAASAIESGDLEFFKIVPEMPAPDRRSMLSIQNIMRLHAPGYTYLEIGSAAGGSILPHLSDPACRLAYSVDVRPVLQLDERGRSFVYKHVTTAYMLSNLQKHLPLAAMLKLQTFDLDAAQLTTEHIGRPCDLLFIDAEHTNVAVFRDFLNTLKFAKPSAIVAFHDANLVFDGLTNVECFLQHQGIKHRALVLPDTVFVILLGDFVELAGNALARSALDRPEYVERAKRGLWQQIAQNLDAPPADPASANA